MAWELSDGLERRGARLRRQWMRHSEDTPNALPGYLYVRESLLLAVILNRRSQFIPPGLLQFRRRTRHVTLTAEW